MAAGGEQHRGQTTNISQHTGTGNSSTSTNHEVSGVKRSQEHDGKRRKRMKRLDEIEDPLTRKVVEGGYGYQRARYITENAFPEHIEDLRFAIASYGESREAMAERGVDMTGVPEKLDIDQSKLVRIYLASGVWIPNNENFVVNTARPSNSWRSTQCGQFRDSRAFPV